MLEVNRRSFLVTGLAAGAAVTLGGLAAPSSVRADPKVIELPPLPYDFKALEPHIDAETMEIHHGRHHKAFVDLLNTKLKDFPDVQGVAIEELVANKCAKAPEAIRKVIQNAGGGHLNHSLFWVTLAPNAGGEPGGKLADAIKSTFGTFAAFTEKMNDAGKNQFGSGWAWLNKLPDGKLEVTSTPNQDSPIMDGKTPLFGIDVWEHAYYLKYRNKRPDYLKAIWNVVNWKEVEKRFDAK